MFRIVIELILAVSKENISDWEPGALPTVNSIRSLRACPMIGLQRMDVLENQSEAAADVAVSSARPVLICKPNIKPNTVKLWEITVVGRFTVTRLLILGLSKENASV